MPHRSDPHAGTLIALYLATALALIAAEGWLSLQARMVVAAIKVLAVMLLLFASVAIVEKYTRSFEAGVMVVVGYLLLTLKMGSAWALAPLAIAGVVWLRDFSPATVITFVVRPAHWGAVLGATSLLLSISTYADFLIVEKAWQGAAHQDTLFHASIAGMLKTYGIASTGLNGLVPMGYHILSHQSLAALSILTNVPILEMYGVAQMVILSPLLLCAASWAALRLMPVAMNADAGRTWLLTCAVLLTLEWLPLAVGGAANSYFNSESYTLGLALFLLALPGVVGAGTSLRKDMLTTSLLVVSGLAKISVGAVGLGLLAIRAIVWPVPVGRVRSLTVAALGVATLAIAMRNSLAGGTEFIVFEPFYLARSYAKFGPELDTVIGQIGRGYWPAPGTLALGSLAVTLCLIANFLVTVATIARRAVVSGPASLWRHSDAVFSLAAFGVGFVALQLRWSGSWYFLNQAMFVSMPFLVAALSAEGTWFRSRWPIAVVGVVSIVAGAVLVVQGYRDQPLGPVFVKSYHYVDRLQNRGAGGHIDELLQLRPRIGSAQVILTRQLTFPPPANIWDCFQVPFTYPAVTEHAWIGVIDTTSKCTYHHYGYPNYFVPGSTALRDPVTPMGVAIVDAATLLAHDL